MRITWLADVLRAAGLEVVEVPGWRTRGSDDFDPIGVTWHATAGSRKGTAQGEVNVILNGSTSAPPPIAQLMIWRDGVIYVCAAGRCNHNKVGWSGPNKGLGNRRLVGIEKANDNKGEPWPEVQLDAARRATAAIMRKLGADPMRRLAAHYEHQPYVGRPAGETSTKTDPFGVDMDAERPRVAALIEGDDMPTAKEIVDELLGTELPFPYDPARPVRAVRDLLRYIPSRDIVADAVDERLAPRIATLAAAVAALDVVDDADRAAIAAQLLAGLPRDLAKQVVDELTARLAA